MQAATEGGEVGVEKGLKKVLGRQLLVAVVFYLLQVPCLDSDGANGSGIYFLQPPSGAEAQYKLDATGTNI